MKWVFKVFSVVSVILLITLSQCGKDDEIIRSVGDISSRIGNEHCPDPRLSVWDISFEYRNGNLVLMGETDDREAVSRLVDTLSQRFTNIPLVNEIKILPDDAVGELDYGVVINSVANLRSSPSYKDELVSQTLLGLPVEILKREKGYFLSRVDDGYLGWISDDEVIQGGDSLRNFWEAADKVVFIEIEGVVHSEPYKDSYPISDVVLGNRFRYLERKADWVRVGYPDGREGYIPVDKVMDLDVYLSKQVNSDGVVKVAKSLLGRPYLWGAASPKAMDCSGFVQVVFRDNGLLLPRDANMQVNIGEDVDTSGFFRNLMPGDLLFFGPSPGCIVHAGIYLGDFSFIHCSGRVRIDSFNPKDENYNEYRTMTIQKVKRVTG